MDVTITPRALSGTVAAIPSKSDAHRLLMALFLAGAPLPAAAAYGGSEDIAATRGCLASLEDWRSAGAIPTLDCGESGSTLRFLLPVAAALGAPAVFAGRGRLPQRPLGPLLGQMRDHGVSIPADTLPLSLSGKMRGGTFALPGDLSSQYITGLLFALPLCGGGEICLLSPLQSAGYVEMTRDTLRRFGVEVQQSETGFSVPASAYAAPEGISPEGDWSNAAFWLCAGALEGPVTVTGLCGQSRQGDRAIVRILREFGAEHYAGTVCGAGDRLNGVTIDAGVIPDLIPVLAVVAAAAKGETHIVNAARLRLKESDRLSATAQILAILGADVTETPDSLIIRGGKPLRGGTVSGYGDHRMVMAAAIASIICTGPVTITGCEAVNKSYPDFFADFQKLGGIIDVKYLR